LKALNSPQSDLEWIAKHWFAQDKSESWSLISEEELKKNARFQSDQVAKYLVTAPLESKSRLLQFRQMGQSSEKDLSWVRIEELFRASLPIYENILLKMKKSGSFNLKFVLHLIPCCLTPD
jgi:hypothetical protein